MSSPTFSTSLLGFLPSPPSFLSSLSPSLSASLQRHLNLLLSDPYVLEQSLIMLLILLISVVALNLGQTDSSKSPSAGPSPVTGRQEADFRRLWPSIAACEHSSLVLPPECRWVGAEQKPTKEEKPMWSRVSRGFTIASAGIRDFSSGRKSRGERGKKDGGESDEQGERGGDDKDTPTIARH